MAIRKPIPPPPVATHLTGTLRAMRAHLNRPVSIEAARDKVLQLAAADDPIPDDARLIERLEKGCRCKLAELANHAKDWPG